MSRGESTREPVVTPADLREAFDSLLFRWGQEEPNGTVATEFLGPGSDEINRGIRVEKQPYYVLGRYDTGGGERYRFGIVWTHNGTSVDTVAINDEGVSFVSDSYVQTGTDSWEIEKDEGEYDQWDIAEMHALVTNPEIRNRQREIDRFYKSRHYQRSRVGRAVARLLRTDEPKFA